MIYLAKIVVGGYGEARGKSHSNHKAKAPQTSELVCELYAFALDNHSPRSILTIQAASSAYLREAYQTIA